MPILCLRPRSGVYIALLIYALITAGAVRAELSLETETARVNPLGAVEVGTEFRYQNEKSGHEFEQLTALEFGMPGKTELLVEFSPWVEIAPKRGPRAVGVGDTSITLTWLAFEEKKKIPAIAFAIETKVPTAKNRDIGTGKEDYSMLINFSKDVTKGLEIHGNLGLIFNGRPRNEKLKDQALISAAVEYTIPKSKFELFGEVVETSASSPNKHADFGDQRKTFGSAGIRYHAHDEMYNPFIRATYDNSHAKNLLIGMTVHFGKKEQDANDKNDDRKEGKEGEEKAAK